MLHGTIPTRRKPNIRQRRAAKLVIDNMTAEEPRPITALIEEAGYAPSVAHNAVQVTESDGFKQAMRGFGLTEELIASALTTDIKEKPGSRVAELRLGADVLGMVKRDPEPTKPSTNTTYNFIFSDKVQERVRVIDAEIKDLLINGTPDVQ